MVTSANVSDEPIAFVDDDALVRLAPLADLFLLHDREIQTRTDDSVAGFLDHYDVTLEPGDVLFNPPFMWHDVINRTPSIAVVVLRADAAEAGPVVTAAAVKSVSRQAIFIQFMVSLLRFRVDRPLGMRSPARPVRVDAVSELSDSRPVGVHDVDLERAVVDGLGEDDLRAVR